MTLPVEIHTEALFGSSGERLPLAEMEFLKTLLTLWPQVPDQFDWRIVAHSFPENRELGLVGLHRITWLYDGEPWLVYFTYSGFHPIEIRKITRDQTVEDNPGSRTWIRFAAGQCRRLHEIIASSSFGV